MMTGKLAVLASPAVLSYHAGMHADSSAKRQGITWFVSRHPGAIEWAQRQNLAIDCWVGHLDTVQVKAGDIVIGTLPVNLAADVCKLGARYLHLSLKVPAEWRGRELTIAELLAGPAELKAFHIEEAR